MLLSYVIFVIVLTRTCVLGRLVKLGIVVMLVELWGVMDALMVMQDECMA